MPLNNEWYIAFDGGGTKTECLIGDSRGRILATAKGSSTNLKSRPPEKVKEEIYHLLDELFQLANIWKNQIKGVFVSTAGGDREEDRKRWEQWILAYGIKPNKLSIANDAVAALAAGSKAKNGIVLIAGTGSIAYSVNDGLEKPIRVGGWGYLLGDEGSGYDIGNKALRIILRSHDGRDDKHEKFSEYILEQIGLKNPEQLITFLYEDSYPRKLIASIARHVISLAEQREPTAKAVIQQAIDQLVELVVPLIRHDDIHSPLVVSGGLFLSPYFKQTFEKSMQLKGFTLPIISPQYPPVVGAYMSALIQGGEMITDKVENNINQSWNRAYTEAEK